MMVRHVLSPHLCSDWMCIRPRMRGVFHYSNRWPVLHRFQSCFHYKCYLNCQIKRIFRRQNGKKSSNPSSRRVYKTYCANHHSFYAKYKTITTSTYRLSSQVCEAVYGPPTPPIPYTHGDQKKTLTNLQQP